ncbi:MAG: peptidoglycan editing factor PgeF [Betaproteobacteria bacterium]|nr:peptidoglycan editing factor PgeF [Betaproteobacteria bacterium]
MKNELDLIFPDWSAPDNVCGFSTTRYGGVSPHPYHGRRISEGGLNLAMHVGDMVDCVEQNRNRIRQWLPNEPLWLNQVHGTTVVRVESVSGLPDADASFSTKRHAICLVQTADCLPVLFCDTAGRVVAAAHAGWRGLAKGILEETLRSMRRYGAGEILAWLGPAIGPDHFEVGTDVLEVFVAGDKDNRRYFKPQIEKPGKYLADIYALARKILEKHDVRKISGGNFCTVSDAARFYSYRRDGITGRMASCIWLR